MRDNYLWQLVTFLTIINNILDLILTNVPDKIVNLEGFEDISNTDHKILSFELDLRIRRASIAKRTVYNFKRANWPALKELLLHTPWDLAFYPNDINKSLSTWTDLLLSTVNEHIPKCTKRSVCDHSWIDTELLALIKKEKQTKKESTNDESVHGC